MKKLLCVLLIASLLLLTLVGCVKTKESDGQENKGVVDIFTGSGNIKTLHCDHCGKAVEVEEDSNMEEDWLIYCAECNEELFADDPVLGELMGE